MKMKLKKGDHVVVTSGKDKGKTGTIYRVLPAENKIVIEGVAMKKRHVKGRAGAAGQIVESPRAIDASNVMFVDPESKKPTRLGRKTADDGKKVRFAKKSGKVLS
jgi:large subunit ribosomal protein L24